MTDSAAEQVAAPIDAGMYNAYVAGLTLHNVELVRLFAARTGPGRLAKADFATDLSYAQAEQVVNYRYDVAAKLSDEDGEEIGRVEVAAVVVTSSTAPADEAIIGQFSSTSAAMMAFPFLREAVASTAQRIGFPGVVMPIVRAEPEGGG